MGLKTRSAHQNRIIRGYVRLAGAGRGARRGSSCASAFGQRFGGVGANADATRRGAAACGWPSLSSFSRACPPALASQMRAFCSFVSLKYISYCKAFGKKYAEVVPSSLD